MAVELLWAEELADALVRARVISANDVPQIERIVIDVQPGKPVAVHVQRTGERNLLDVLPLLARAEQKG